MSKTSAERIGYVTEQLIQRTVPIYPEDDEETAEQRLDEAYVIAMDIINRYCAQYITLAGFANLLVAQGNQL